MDESPGTTLRPGPQGVDRLEGEGGKDTLIDEGAGGGLLVGGKGGDTLISNGITGVIMSGGAGRTRVH